MKEFFLLTYEPLFLCMYIYKGSYWLDSWRLVFWTFCRLLISQLSKLHPCLEKSFAGMYLKTEGFSRTRWSGDWRCGVLGPTWLIILPWNWAKDKLFLQHYMTLLLGAGGHHHLRWNGGGSMFSARKQGTIVFPSHLSLFICEYQGYFLFSLISGAIMRDIYWSFLLFFLFNANKKYGCW